MLNIIKSLFNKYFYLISLIIFIISNLFVIDNLPFGDDYVFIFGETEIKNAPNPFLFFFPWSDYFKSWGFSYFFLWNMYKIFGTNFVYYRVINLILHFVNFIVFRKLLDQKEATARDTKSNMISLFFLFAPLSILTTSWIFQIKTLLALFFILLLLLQLKKQKIHTLKDNLKNYFLFLFSLLSKVSVILIPIYLLFFYRKNKKSGTKTQLIMIPFFLTSLLYGVINIKGITHLVTENEYLKKETSEIVINNNVSRSEVLSIKKKDTSKHKEFNFNIDIYSEVTEGASKYFNPLSSISNFSHKYILSLQNFGRFIFSALGIYDFYPFYENNLETTTSKLLYVYSFVGFFALVLLLKLREPTVLLLICLFLPISGFFYIPYMKFSYSSDHWFYTALIPLLLILHKKVENIRVIMISFTVCFSSYLYTQYKYTSFPSLLVKNKIAFENRIITEHQARYRLLSGETLPILNEYYKKFKTTERNNHEYSTMIYKLARRHHQDKILKELYNLNAKLYLRTQDINIVKNFTLEHFDLFPEYILDFTEAFNAFYSHKLEKELYQKISKKLDQ
jgi:hypothetical protein